MIHKPQLTVHTTIDTDNQRLNKNSSKIKELFLATTIEIPPTPGTSRSAIKFEPVKIGRPEDLHLYVHAQDPRLMREIQLKEGALQDQVLSTVDAFLCDLQNTLQADYVRVDFSEGTLVYQSIGQTEIKKIDLTNVEEGKYLPEFHKIQQGLGEVIDDNERVEYLERKPGFRGIDQTNLFSPPLTERFSTLHQVIIPRLLQTIKSEPKKIKFLERVIFLDSLVEKLVNQSFVNLKRAQWDFEEVQKTPSDPKFSQREQELQEAKKENQMLQQLDFAALYTIAAHLENKNSKGHLSAAREIEKFLSSILARMGQKSWQHQENFAKKAVSILTLNRFWGKLQPLTADESDYAYRMGALSLPAGDRILYKEYIKESGQEVVDMPVLQVLIEAMRDFPDSSFSGYKELLRATPYNFLGIQEALQPSKEASLNASYEHTTSDELVQHLQAR